MLCWQDSDHSDIFINQRIECYLNNTIILRPLTPHIMPCYTHKCRTYRGRRFCDVISPYVYVCSMSELKDGDWSCDYYSKTGDIVQTWIRGHIYFSFAVVIDVTQSLGRTRSSAAADGPCEHEMWVAVLSPTAKTVWKIPCKGLQ